jgi:hypothetical protein
MDNMGFREFCALILLVASYESNQMLDCLYKNGALFFDILSGGQSMITGERLKSLGRIIGVPE